MTTAEVADAPGCWVVWREDIESILVEVHNDELAAYKSAYCGSGVGFEVTWVPYGMSPYDVIEIEKRERESERAAKQVPLPPSRTMPSDAA